MGTTCLLLLASCTASPVNDVAYDRVDLVEVNHFYDDKGHLVFDQIIFYDWSASRRRFNVRDWRLLKSPAQMPQRDWRDDSYVALWHDGGVLRKVRADSFRESWTQYDPELIERAFLPKNMRRELHKATASAR